MRRVLLALSGLAALAGLALGLRLALLTEGDVIAAAADRWVAEEGGRRTDCVGVPDEPPAWVTVICRPGDGAAKAIYQADRLGRIMRLEPADPAGAART